MEQKLAPKIIIKGKEYPCRITMGAMLRFKRETGKDVSELNDKDISELIAFVWSCTCSACSADGVEFNLTVEQFADSLEPKDLQGFTNHMNAQKKIVARGTK